MFSYFKTSYDILVSYLGIFSSESNFFSKRGDGIHRSYKVRILHRSHKVSGITNLGALFAVIRCQLTIWERIPHPIKSPSNLLLSKMDLLSWPLISIKRFLIVPALPFLHSLGTNQDPAIVTSILIIYWTEDVKPLVPHLTQCQLKTRDFSPFLSISHRRSTKSFHSNDSSLSQFT